MTPEQFAYWLQGYTELSDSQLPSKEQWELIKSHLQTVFTKVTPPLYKPNIAYANVTNKLEELTPTTGNNLHFTC